MWSKKSLIDSHLVWLGHRWNSAPARNDSPVGIQLRLEVDSVLYLLCSCIDLCSHLLLIWKYLDCVVSVW